MPSSRVQGPDLNLHHRLLIRKLKEIDCANAEHGSTYWQIHTQMLKQQCKALLLICHLHVDRDKHAHFDGFLV